MGGMSVVYAVPHGGEGGVTVRAGSLCLSRFPAAEGTALPCGRGVRVSFFRAPPLRGGT